MPEPRGSDESDRAAFVEVRAARGVGDPAEAVLFAAEVLRALTRVGEERAWRFEVQTLEEAHGGLRRAEVEIRAAPTRERAT